MKKIIVFFVVFVMVLMTYATPKIQINKPVAGVTIYKNYNNYQIRWTSTEPMYNRVKIRLYNKALTERIDVIADGIPLTDNDNTNIGTFVWTKAKISLIDPGEYRIRVKTMDDRVFCDSDVFRIKEKLNVGISDPIVFKKPVGIFFGKIVVEEPLSNSIHKVGKSISIKWNKSFGNYEFVHIDIYHIDGVKVKGYTCSNTGISSWTPTSLYNNKPFYLEIKSQDNKFSGKIGNFSLILPLKQRK